jgi:nitrogen fixation/metabolism regulation signal transduction histidine kinase
MNAKPDNRRWKNFLIRKDVQLPIIATNLVFLAVVSAVLIAVLLSPLYIGMLHGKTLWLQQAAGKLFLILLPRVALALVLILVAASVHQLVLSHRFCGPLVNFGYTFDKMARGDFSRYVHLRKKDFLSAEAACVNAILDRLNSDGRNLGTHLNRMATITAQLEKQATSPEAKAMLDELHRSLEASRDTVTAWVICQSDGGVNSAEPAAAYPTL